MIPWIVFVLNTQNKFQYGLKQLFKIKINIFLSTIEICQRATLKFLPTF